MIPPQLLGTATTPSQSQFTNRSSQLLLEWRWSGSNQKSLEELNALVHNVLHHPEFCLDELKEFNARTETSKLDAQLSAQDDAWKESGVEIQVPDGQPHPGGNGVPTFTVPGLIHRSLTAIIKSVWSSSSSIDFHYSPFRLFYQRPTPTVTDGLSGDSEAIPPQRVYDELYSSEAFNIAHEELQKSVPEPDCTLERVICAMMFWSDSTHLVNFGDASLWPLYMFFGNQSKYTRSKPSSGACHHVAYIPKVRQFHDWYHTLNGLGLGPNADTLAHCRRELMHEIWRLLLDDEFMHAYTHGIVLKCADGVWRRVYPRIFTYSADYPEKVLLASIRNLGACPCPRCTIRKDKIPEVGMKRDDARRVTEQRIHGHTYNWDMNRAREHIYHNGRGVKSTVVENLLSKFSYNAFVEKLSTFGHNIFSLFVVDLMHEFELGVFKSIFTHLIRMLISIGNNTIQVFNERFVQSSGRCQRSESKGMLTRS
ncbi:hypothetical protein K474DRAFT_1606873 [Panus rudis PR-1116 ss-1]|nr:hypothetical protein K474DRAFT_1606873 [Panus rudis PR-1116 ss-1]